MVWKWPLNHLTSTTWLLPKKIVMAFTVGRTARKGEQGNALLFLLPSEKAYLDVLKGHGISLAHLSLQDTLLSCTPARFAKFKAPEEVSESVRTNVCVRWSRHIPSNNKDFFALCFLSPDRCLQLSYNNPSNPWLMGKQAYWRQLVKPSSLSSVHMLPMGKMSNTSSLCVDSI